MDSVNKVKFSRYNSTFYSGSSDKTISKWDIRTGLLVNTFYGHTSSITSIFLGESENELSSCDSSGKVILWDLRMNKIRGEIQCSKESVNSIVMDPSIEFGFAASSDSMIYVLDL